jgi:hypothetical protein
MLSGEVLNGWARAFGLNAAELGRVKLDNGAALLELLAAGLLLLYVTRKLRTAWWTLRAAALTPTLSRMIAGLVRTRDYSGEEFLRADGPALGGVA